MAEGKFAGAYDLLFSHYLKSVRKKIMNIVKKYGCKNIIDLGCGTGEQCRMLFNEGMKVVGVDASLHMINYARKVSSAGTKYLVSDILSLDTKKFSIVPFYHLFYMEIRWKSRKRYWKKPKK